MDLTERRTSAAPIDETRTGFWFGPKTPGRQTSSVATFCFADAPPNLCPILDRGADSNASYIAQVSRLFESGSSLILLPVAAKMAFDSAGAMSDTPGSPTPAGGALLLTT
jgi:hypothetical protein